MEINYTQFQASTLYLQTLDNMHMYVERVNKQNEILERSKYESWYQGQLIALGLITPSNPNMTLAKVNNNQFVPTKHRLIVDAPSEGFGDQNTISIIEGEYIYNPSPTKFEMPSRLQGHITAINPTTGEKVAKES